MHVETMVPSFIHEVNVLGSKSGAAAFSLPGMMQQARSSFTDVQTDVAVIKTLIFMFFKGAMISII